MERHTSLDALRGLAVLLVIGFHLDLPGLRLFGWVGVDIFFVLSGFLISELLFRNLEENGRLKLQEFWVRRAFKIFPPLYFFLAAIAALSSVLHIFPGRSFLAAMFFFSNYLSDPNQAGGLVAHTWSLAVEEHFYFFFPLLVSALVVTRSRQPLRWLPIIFVGVATSCFLLRCIDTEHWSYTHLRVDALFAGVTLRYLARFKPGFSRYFHSWIAFVCGATFWVPTCVFHHFGPVVRSSIYSWNWFSAACLIAWCFSRDDKGMWRKSPMRILSAVGFNSYSIYLWQAPICILFRDIAPGWFFKSVGVAASVSIGTLMANLVELPAVRSRDRMFRGSRDQVQIVDECRPEPVNPLALSADQASESAA